MHRCSQSHHPVDCHSDSEFDNDTSLEKDEPLSLIEPPLPQDALDDGLGIHGKNYMVLRTCCPMDGLNSNETTNENGDALDGTTTKETFSFSNLINSVGNADTILQKCSIMLLQFLTCSQRMFWFFTVLVAIFYFYPFFCILVVAGMAMMLFGAHGETQTTTRTARWTVTGYSYQLRDGFLVSPYFLDKCGQWRMIIKQKRGMDGLQTSFGLMCTDIYPDIELVTATVTFFCTNVVGQEIATGGMRNLRFQHDYQLPGDCGFSRHIRLPKKLMGQSETITVHCTVEFRKKTVTFLKTLARTLNSVNSNGGEDADGDASGRWYKRRGKNIVSEHGVISPGNIEFHDENQLPPEFRPVIRFVRHSGTRTFVWEIPEFCSLLENTELWGVYSPQFFVQAHDICAIWRMKLLEVQGVFRLHVQLRGIPRDVKQVKLWYLLQLVDMYGDSVIPEHAVSRVKYPDYMNLWETTRHILYRRETILERFVGGTNNGSFTLRISLQMEPNDLTLTEVDSDEWIQRSGGGQQMSETGASETVMPCGVLRNSVNSIPRSQQRMITS